MIRATDKVFIYCNYGSVTRKCEHCGKVLIDPSPKGEIYDLTPFTRKRDSSGVDRCGACGNRAAIL